MSFILLDSKAYFHNLQILSDKLGGVDKLSVVLKDNAYGHGLIQMASLAGKFGVKRAVVKTLDEAESIKEYFTDILILCDIPDKQIDKRFAITINSLHDIKQIPPSTSVHLKVDTGMHRNGINPVDIEKAIFLISEQKLKLTGVMTHFRSADEDTNDLFWQMKNWQEIKQKVTKLLKKHNFSKPLFHCANSATVLRIKNYEDDFARCGISTYGYTEISDTQVDLKPVLSLWGEKINSLKLKKGERVGYGGVFETKCDMLISTYDIGYGDGFFRYNGIGNLTTPKQKRLLGRTSMDSMSIEGNDDKVCIFNDAKKISKYFNTISYDILVKLSPSISRKLF